MQSITLSLSVLTAIFQVNPGQPVLSDAKDDGTGGDNWSYRSCKAPFKSSPPRNQHPVFYRPDALPVAQPTVSKHWRENITFHGLAYPKLTWVFQLCLWPLIAPGYLGGGLPCLSSALWCQYPDAKHNCKPLINQKLRLASCLKINW